MKNRNLTKLLPKTGRPGAIYLLHVRCGKNNCHCASSVGHGAYHYYVRRVGRRLHKTYIPQRRVHELQGLIDAARHRAATRREAALSSARELRRVSERLRETERSIANVKGVRS